MRIVSWNILQGGGSRLGGICEALAAWQPDIVALQEVRQTSADRLRDSLAGAGLRHSYLAEAQTRSENTLLLASRSDLDAGDFLPDRTGQFHILEATTFGLTILPLHFPQKQAQVPLFEALLQDSESLLSLPSLLIGDLNCGLPFEDSTGKTFANARYFQALKDAGWTDLFRHLHGSEAREFSWISPRTGRGFRYDHALAGARVTARTTSLHYDHSPRINRLSDHSALILDLDGPIGTDARRT